MKTFKKMTLPRILSVIFILFLPSCMATPDIHVKSSDMSIAIKKESPAVMRVAVSLDGKYILSGSIDSTFRLWDISAGKEIRKFIVNPINTNMGQGVQVAFSSDGKHAISVGADNFKIWDISTGGEVSSFDIGSSYVTSISISADGRYALIPFNILFSSRLHLYLLGIGSDKVIKLGKSVKTWGSDFVSAAISPDGKYALSGHGDGKIELWDIAKEKVIKKIKGRSFFPSGITSVAFSPDGKYALSGGTDNTVKYWDVTSGAEIKSFKGHTSVTGILSVTFSPDGKLGLSGGCDALIKLWDLTTGAELKTFTGHTSGGVNCVTSVQFTPDGSHIVSGGDASVRIWDVATGEEIATMIGFEDGEWIVLTTEGYYNSSEKGAQYHTVKMGGKDYSVDSFYDVFYRPDMVAAKLRGEDIKDLITIIMKDAIKTPPPVVEISPIASSPTSSKAKVCYNIKSTGGGIGEVRLFHNGKLIESDGFYKEAAKAVTEKTQLVKLNSKTIYEDMRSVKIKGIGEISPVTTKTKGEVFNDCKEIEAISGENEISITAFNKGNTVQGYMQTAKFTSTIKQEEPHLYILSIGIDQYKDNSINLKYAVKDSKDIEERLLKQAKSIYKPRNIHYELFTDDNATKANIISKINELSQKIKPTDSFILFVAGHGILLQNQYYMLTHDFDGKVNDNNLISSNEIVEFSKKIKSLSQLFIFDTCHAGGVDYIVSGLYDARMSVLAKKMGLHIYASASDKQSALDGYQGNGLFTYILLDGLNNKIEADKNQDKQISLTELGGYTKQTTTEISKKIGHQQTPLIINFGKDNAVYELR
ncbi:MAG: caspase family protein [Deltaproteobacteria bacterium]|nr:caspase family protein [Deltaproteobacteria bacterium]